MGWSFCDSHTEKSHIVSDRVKFQQFKATRPGDIYPISTGDEITITTLKYSVVGNHLWKVMENKNLVTGKTDRYLALDLLSKREGAWGYKDLCESMGPYYYDCPLKFLDMVPVENQEWRDSVRKYHAKKSKMAGLKIELGKTYKAAKIVKGIPEFRITNLKPLMGAFAGRNYKLSKKHLELGV